MRSSKEFRALARAQLRGKWGMSVLITFVAGLLGGLGGGSSSSVSREAATNEQFVDAAEPFFSNPLIFSLLSGILVFLLLAALVQLIIGGAVELGHNRYYVGLIGGETPPFSTLFSRFAIFGKALGLRLFMGLFVFLWALLLFIPGIIAAYRYALAPYLMAQYPEKGIRECVDESKALMDGYKGRLFCLHLSFIGWSFLCIFTLGIGCLWLNPYMSAAEAAFYLERTGQIPSPQMNGQWQPQA